MITMITINNYNNIYGDRRRRQTKFSNVKNHVNFFHPFRSALNRLDCERFLLRRLSLRT